MSLDTVTLEPLIRRRKVRFWGASFMVTPRLLDHVEGNGLLVIFVTPMDTRPNYYVLRVDSGWAAGDLNDDDWRDYMDEVYEYLEDGFGPAEEEWTHDNGRTYTRHNDWPAFNDSSGTSWGILGKLEKEDRRPESEIRQAMRERRSA